MAESRAAVRYAKALINLAIETKIEDKVNTDMALIVATVEKHPKLEEIIESPVVRSADKKEVLLEVFKDFQKLSVQLIDVLIDNKRISLLYQVAKKYNQLHNSLKDAQVAKVTTATPLTNDLRSKVLDKVKSLTGKATSIENIVDESILGGFILRLGDLQYDASVSNKLEKLKREFTIN